MTFFRVESARDLFLLRLGCITFKLVVEDCGTQCLSMHKITETPNHTTDIKPGYKVVLLRRQTLTRNDYLLNQYLHRLGLLEPTSCTFQPMEKRLRPPTS